MIWFIGWVPYALVHHLNPFFTTYLDAPTGVNLAWNTDIPLAGVVMWPITTLFGPMPAYNVFVTLAFPFSTWTAFLAIRRFVPSLWGAALGGFIYGFSPYVVGQEGGHPFLVFAGLIPLVLLLLHEAVVRQRCRPWKVGLLLGVAGGAQFLVSAEVGLTSALMALIGVGVLAALHPREVRTRANYVVRTVVSAAPVAAVIVAAPIVEMVTGPQRPPAAVHSPDTYVTDLLNFVVPGDFQTITAKSTIALYRTWSGAGLEEGGYLGIALIVVLIVVVWRHRRSAMVRFAAIMAAIAAVLSMGPHLHVNGAITGVPLPSILFEDAPFLRDILPSRLSVYMWLFAAVLVAQFVADISGYGGVRRVSAGVLLAAAVVLVFPYLSPVVTPAAVPAYFTSGAATVSSGTLLVLPFSDDPPTADPLEWQASGDFRYRMPSGYMMVYDAGGSHPGPAPTPTSVLFDQLRAGLLAPLITPELRQQIAAQFDIWDVRSIAIGPMPHRDATVSFMTGLMGREPERVGEVAVWTGLHGGSEVRVAQ